MDVSLPLSPCFFQLASWHRCFHVVYTFHLLAQSSLYEGKKVFLSLFIRRDSQTNLMLILSADFSLFPCVTLNFIMIEIIKLNGV